MNSYFAGVSLAALPPMDKPLTTVKATDTISNALRALTSAKITSAPVVKEGGDEANTPWTSKYLGLVDMQMISLFAAKHLQNAGSDDTQLAKATLKHRILSDSLVKDVCQDSMFVPMSTSGTMEDLLLFLGKHKLHRVALVDDTGIVNLITQSAVVRELLRLYEGGGGGDVLRVFMDKTLEELGLVKSCEVLTVSLETPVVEAFRLMAHHNVSAMPVLGLDEQIMGNVSVSDIHMLINSEEWSAYQKMSVRKFMEERYCNAAAAGHQSRSIQIPLTCKPTDTLQHVFTRIASTRVHRVYLSDEQGRVVRVLSLCDLLEALVTEADA